MATSIALHLGDITEFPADAIVNAANSTLLGGGGVDGAIHRVGGPAILAETRRIRASTHRDGLPAGEAVATNAGHLPATWVIHTVGPIWDERDDQSAILASCYQRSLELADNLGAHTISFPAISAGAYGWPIDDAARVAIVAVRSAQTRVKQATFVLVSQAAYSAFEAALGS